MQTEMNKTAEEKNQAILKAVDELQCYADPDVFRSALDDVLLDWLSSTEADKDYRGRIYAIFTELKECLTSIEMA